MIMAWLGIFPLQMVWSLQNANSPDRVCGRRSERQSYTSKGNMKHPLTLSFGMDNPHGYYNFVFFQVDIDENNDLAFDYDVSSVPVLVGMINGKEIARIVGLQDTDKLKKFVESIAAQQK